MITIIVVVLTGIINVITNIYLYKKTQNLDFKKTIMYEFYKPYLELSAEYESFCNTNRKSWCGETSMYLDYIIPISKILIENIYALPKDIQDDIKRLNSNLNYDISKFEIDEIVLTSKIEEDPILLAYISDVFDTYEKIDKVLKDEYQKLSNELVGK